MRFEKSTRPIRAFATFLMVPRESRALEKDLAVPGIGKSKVFCRDNIFSSTWIEGRLAETLRMRADAKLATQLHKLKPEEAGVLTLLRQELDQRAQRRPAIHPTGAG
jgi:hypothetical protein